MRYFKFLNFFILISESLWSHFDFKHIKLKHGIIKKKNIFINYFEEFRNMVINLTFKLLKQLQTL